METTELKERSIIHQFIVDLKPLLTAGKKLNVGEFCAHIKKMGYNLASLVLDNGVEWETFWFVDLFEIGLDESRSIENLNGLEKNIFNCGRTVSNILELPWLDYIDLDPLVEAFHIGLLQGIADR